MTATQKQRNRNAPTRRTLMAKVRRDAQTMATITTLADAASAFAEENYTAHPQSAAMRLTATFKEIYWLLPKEIRCRNRK